MDDSQDFLDVYAPLAGVRVPLERIPDPVFAQKLVGDGASVDPTSDTLLAPLDGEVVQLHAAKHALSLRSRSGVEVLVHIGIDTVALRGEGFTALVAVGDRVHRGQPLIRFDLDAVAQRARSLLTQVVVADMEAVAAIELGRGELHAGESVLFRLRLRAPALMQAADTAATEFSGHAVLPNPAGLHARPAAVLADAARRFHSEIQLFLGERQANAKSVVAVLGLGTGHGDELRVVARGADALAARDALVGLLASGCGDSLETLEATVQAPERLREAALAGADGVWHGVVASPGIAVGVVAHWRRARLQVERHGESPAIERARLQQALHDAKAELAILRSSLGDPVRAGILEAHQILIDDPDLLDSTLAGIDRGDSAGFAWQAAFEHHAEVLARLESQLLRERASDLRDVGGRVLARLAGAQAAAVELPPAAIVIAEELTPSDTAGFDPARVRGIVTVGGGPTSHVAILARAMGIPALCGMHAGVLRLADGEQAVLDGGRGCLTIAPSAQALADAEASAVAQAERHAREAASAGQPAHTRDGLRIEVVANVRHAADAEQAVAAGAEGVGLLRSEFLFEAREAAPSEDEQVEAYAAVAAELGAGMPLVIRTLDVGGDKPLPWLPLPQEDNPFLGLRGVRVSLAHPELFRTQLRAILRSAGGAKLQVMLPMVSELAELRSARALLRAEADALGLPIPPLGLMIEVPSAALQAEQFAREVDFFSIGSNDLSQYALAIDRGHAQLGARVDALHPAVLRLIAMSCDGAARHGRWVGLCGALASDPLAVPALIGLGIAELSVVTPAIAAVKAAVARCDSAACRALAAELLELDSAAAVRARLTSFAAA